MWSVAVQKGYHPGDRSASSGNLALLVAPLVNHSQHLRIIAVNPALDQALRRGLVLLARYLAGSFIQVSVGLNKHLSRLLLLQHHIPDLGTPELESDIGHAQEVLGAFFDVGRGLVHVKLLEELANSCRVDVSVTFIST